MIRIEITGDSIPEVADKLLAMARALTVQVSYEADNAAREALQAQRDAAKPKATRKTKAEPEKTAEEITPEATETAASEPEAAVEEITTPLADTLDFDKDVAPVVLDAVAKIGKQETLDLISQFGAARASEVNPAQWPELVELLKGRL